MATRVSCGLAEITISFDMDFLVAHRTGAFAPGKAG
jgi:hypothetical protein